MLLRWLVVIVAGCVVSHEAHAQEAPPAPVVTSGAASTLLEWRTNNRNGISTDDNYGDALVRSQVAVDAETVRVGLRFDSELFARKPLGIDRRNDLRIERVNLDLERTSGRHRVTANLGDFYAQFGRGLVLSLRRVDELGLDVALRGARTDVALADDKVVVTLLAGETNSVNVESQQLRYTTDPRDRLAASRWELRLADTTMAMHGVALKVDELNNKTTTLNYGGSLDTTVGPLGLGFEVDGQQRQLVNGDRSGMAAYATATARWLRTSWLLELKHYDQFEPLRGRLATHQDSAFVYSFSPTAERIDQELIDNTNITGGRLKVDFSTAQASASSVFVSAGLFQSRFADQWFAHGYGGIDQRWNGGRALLLSAGYRREWSATSGDLARAIAHAESDFIAPISAAYSLHFIALHQSHVEALGASRRIFHRGNASIELDIKARWVAVAGFDWNNQNQAPGIRKGFGYGVLRFRVSDALIVQLFAGSQRGGIRCIAGACRDFPPFSGVRLDTTVRF